MYTVAKLPFPISSSIQKSPTSSRRLRPEADVGSLPAMVCRSYAAERRRWTGRVGMGRQEARVPIRWRGGQSRASASYKQRLLDVVGRCRCGWAGRTRVTAPNVWDDSRCVVSRRQGGCRAKQAVGIRGAAALMQNRAGDIDRVARLQSPCDSRQVGRSSCVGEMGATIGGPWKLPSGRLFEGCL